ncbi:MAG: ribonuclease domain-containing protein [Burkholderiaceae bacterium]
MKRSRLITLVLSAVIAAGGYLINNQSGQTPSGQMSAQTSQGSRTTSPTGKSIAEKALPKEAQRTLSLIRQGGRFPYSKDGTVFGNREKRLPLKKRGYYREYTVRTPGVSHRGARRIVSGGPKQNPTEHFYTQDHYETFQLIVEDAR